MINLMIRYGAVAALMLAVFMLLPIVVFGPRPEWMKVGEILGYAWMVLSMGVVVLAIRRERATTGSISFARAFGLSIGVTTVAGLLFGVATWVLYATQGPELTEALLTFYGNQIRESGADAATIAQELRRLESMRPFLNNHALQGVVMFASVFVIGTIVGAIASWILARRRSMDYPSATVNRAETSRVTRSKLSLLLLNSDAGVSIWRWT